VQILAGLPRRVVFSIVNQTSYVAIQVHITIIVTIITISVVVIRIITLTRCDCFTEPLYFRSLVARDVDPTRTELIIKVLRVYAALAQTRRTTQ